MSSQFKMLRVIIQTSSVLKMTKESEFREYIDRLLLTKDFYVVCSSTGSVNNDWRCHWTLFVPNIGS